MCISMEELENCILEYLKKKPSPVPVMILMQRLSEVYKIDRKRLYGPVLDVMQKHIALGMILVSENCEISLKQPTVVCETIEIIDE